MANMVCGEHMMFPERSDGWAGYDSDQVGKMVINKRVQRLAEKRNESIHSSVRMGQRTKRQGETQRLAV